MIKTRYIVLITGTLINLYGQIIVPYFRGQNNPLDLIRVELQDHPLLFAITVILAYLFPLSVSLITTGSVIKRYKKSKEQALIDALLEEERSESHSAQSETVEHVSS